VLGHFALNCRFLLTERPFRPEKSFWYSTYLRRFSHFSYATCTWTKNLKRYKPCLSNWFTRLIRFHWVQFDEMKANWRRIDVIFVPTEIFRKINIVVFFSKLLSQKMANKTVFFKVHTKTTNSALICFNFIEIGFVKPE